jgi:anaerobic selenocysteine-containing dehydrogenase
VEDGRLTAISGNPDHPLNKGGCCAKMKHYVNRVYSPERVLHPMRRQGNAWNRISWDEALDEWAQRIKTIIAQSGPEAILHYQGYGERTALKLLNARFFAHLGGATTLRGSLCSGTAFAAMGQDFGNRISHDPLDHLSSRTIILWGRNPAATQFNMARVLGLARKNGAKIWLVDPAATESLVLCDRHIQVKPGADLHLALGAARSVLENSWEDSSFLPNRTTGFEAFKELVFSQSCVGHAERAGVDPVDMFDLAEAMCKSGPAAVLLGWGLHRYVGAHASVRAIDALAAITGNIGIPGGGVSQGFEEYGPYDQTVWGEELHSPRRTLLMPEIGAEILGAENPPVRMAVVSAANPVCMAPDSGQVALAFASREYVVYLGHFMDDTARHAHLFLPCTTFLEEDDIVASYGHNYVGPVNKTVEPLGQCRSQFDIYQSLARRFPFAQEFVRPLDEWLGIICRPFLEKGFTLNELRKGPIRDPDAPMVPWGDGAFLTTSGRFEFIGELPETTVEDPEYPLTLLTTGSPKHLCSELTLAEHSPLPEARVHPETGRELGLADNSPAYLKSDLGRMTVLAVFDSRQRKDVCLCRRGGWITAGHGLNRLIQARVSSLGSGTAYYQTRVILRPVDSKDAGN